MKTNFGTLSKIWALTLLIALSSVSAKAEGTHGPDTTGKSIPAYWPGEMGPDSIRQLKDIANQCTAEMGADVVDRISQGTLKVSASGSENGFEEPTGLPKGYEFIKSHVRLLSLSGCVFDSEFWQTWGYESTGLLTVSISGDLDKCKDFPQAARQFELRSRPYFVGNINYMNGTGLFASNPPVPTIRFKIINKIEYDQLFTAKNRWQVASEVQIVEDLKDLPLISFYNVDDSEQRTLVTYPTAKLSQCLIEGISKIAGPPQTKTP